ncbi:MAG: WecB/TagA/CpsF family glycosyltransferase [Paludibacter sp.]|jgi:N-acetylglucosaminyldiphosphoundecaprenol N-acetyl-beta-D-mannosaminyltransferase|nr:WecB/TagA/CpsF family glycosyltransferase [Paludibacter sp.]
MKADEVFEFADYKLIVNSLDCVPSDKKYLINTVSPNSYGISTYDKAMDDALKGTDFLILDGLYFGWLPLFKYGKRIKRITGWDSFQHFSQRTNERGGKVFFLGSSTETLKKIVEKYKIDFPNIEIATYSPPFKPEFTDEDNRAIHAAVNAFKPDVLFVGMTAPKQEKWSFQNKQFVDTQIISTIGNVFDWYAGNSTRPNAFWQKIGLEWLVRIYYRPGVFRRNIRNQMIFFWHLFLVMIKVKKI